MPWKPFHVEERGVAQILKHQFHFQPPTSLIPPTQTGGTFIFLNPNPKQGTLQPKNILFSYLVEQIMLKKKILTQYSEPSTPEPGPHPSGLTSHKSPKLSPCAEAGPLLTEPGSLEFTPLRLRLHCFLHFIHLPLLNPVQPS